MSLIMVVRADSWDDMDTDMPTRHITDIGKVLEVTPASLPAYEGTDINARSGQRALDSAAKALESARSELDSSKNERDARQQQEEKGRERLLRHYAETLIRKD
jgi:phage head maturation protease